MSIALKVETVPRAMPSPVYTDDSVLTEREAGAYLKLNPKTLGIWRAAGKGPAYLKFGRAVRYSMRDLREWQQAVRVDPTMSS